MRYKTQNHSCKTFKNESSSFPENVELETLLSLQGDVLDVMEDSGHPEFATARKDHGVKDGATKSERIAWLAIYGPMTDVQID